MSLGLPIYGKCDECGRSGLDDDTGAANSGYILEEYDGKQLCKLCIIRHEDQAHSSVVQEQINQDTKLLNTLGFTN